MNMLINHFIIASRAYSQQVNTLHLALSYLMDHEEARVAYLAGDEETRKKWYYTCYRAFYELAMGL